MDDLIDKLKSLGLNTYEAKVYLALLKHHPATGYEVSKESGVPQARAYDTLKALETRGIVVSNAGKPITYLPISPAELLDQWERSFKGSVDYLRKTLPTLGDETVEPILNFRGKTAVIENIERMISQAQEQIFLEIWKLDADRFEPALRAAAARGVDLKIVGYNGVSFDFCNVYQHALAGDIEESLGGRWLFMTVDNREGLVGNLPVGERIPKVVCTRNEGIVFIIKELVIHDIFLLEIEEKLPAEIERAFGKNLNKLRQKILGEAGLLRAGH